MSISKIHIGRDGEEHAAQYLQARGYEIVTRNYCVRGGEIDIVARDPHTLIFVEVKSYRSHTFGEAETWVDERKQKRIGVAADRFLAQYEIDDVDCRFDVITVNLAQQPPQIKHIENAFWLDE